MTPPTVPLHTNDMQERWANDPAFRAAWEIYGPAITSEGGTDYFDPCDEFSYPRLLAMIVDAAVSAVRPADDRVYVAMMLRNDRPLEQHMSGVFSTAEKASEHCRDKNRWAEVNRLGYYFDYHTRFVDEPERMP